MRFVTNVVVYIMDSADGIPPAVKNCSHCSAIRWSTKKGDKVILCNQTKVLFDPKAQRPNIYLYTNTA